MTRPISRIDLNLLGVFEAIYSRGGVTAAARHLHLTQSAISHSLAKLRVAFDDELFVRFGNAMVPTALARAIIGPVRDALGMVEQALVAADRSLDSARAAMLPSLGLTGSAGVACRRCSRRCLRVSGSAQTNLR
jgi:DNA-binding transcriptional LysR family regulator